MARGLSQPMATSTNINDKAGSSACVRGRNMRRCSMSLLLKKGGLDDARLGQFFTRNLSYDRTVMENICAIAIAQFVQLRCIPEEGPAPPRLLGDDVIDLEFGGDIHAAHGVIHQDDLSIRSKRAGKQCLLLVAPGKRQDSLVYRCRADPHAVAPFLRHGPGLPGTYYARSCQSAQ